MSFDSYESPESEALLRVAQGRLGADRTPHRQLVTELTAAALFLVCAACVSVLFAPSRPFSWTALLATSAVFAAAQRVKFPVASGWTWPTQLAFVPMVFLLPLWLVPFLVAALRVLDLMPRLIRGSASGFQSVVKIADCWYTLAPVLVVSALGGSRFSWGHCAIYVLAFTAQIALDAGTWLLRDWFGAGVRPSAQPKILWAYSTDAALTCVGLMFAAEAGHGHPLTLVLVVPLIGLFGLFARERQERMDNTLALSTAYRGTALLLGDVIEDDDEYTGIHSRAVVDLSLAVSDRLGLDSRTRLNIEFGALLHDVGKIRVPKEIIHKPGALTEAEWQVMREHTVWGEEMLRQVGGTLSGVGRVVRHSHERWDGSGYPDKLAGEAIPIEARVISACDAFNAMTTDRPYRRAMTHEMATSEIHRCAGSHFDPMVVQALLDQLTAEQLLSERGGLGTAGRHETKPRTPIQYVGSRDRAFALGRREKFDAQHV